MPSFLVFSNLSQFTRLRHYISTRADGYSLPPYDSLNLSTQLNDDKEAVQKNRDLIANHLQVASEKSFFPQQTHSSNVAIVNASTTAIDLLNTDALITAAPNISISVLAADCVPVLLYDAKNQVIAAIHAGWKGTIGKIITKTILSMQHNFGCSTQNIYAGIGPSISMASFEVGNEVAQQFIDLYGGDTTIIRSTIKTGKAHVDLWQANKLQLIAAGIPDSHIEINGLCSFSNPKLFFSARRDGFETGRFAVGATLLNI